MMPTTKTTVQTTLPTRPAEQMDALTREGWFPNADVLIAEALRRFLDTHRAELMQRFTGGPNSLFRQRKAPWVQGALASK